MEKYSPSRIELINEFNIAPIDTLFSQKTVAALRDCSVATLERDRWAGNGIPFTKIGRHVRYRKQDVLDFLSGHATVRSTSEGGASQ